MTQPTDQDKDQLWSEATLWFARMRSPEADALRPEFEAWLARGALHRRYYNRAAEYWVDSGTALTEPVGRSPNDRFKPHSQSLQRRRQWAVGTLVAASIVLAGTTLLALRDRHPRTGERPIASTQAPHPSLELATLAGEQRTARLDDGSIVTLASDTILRAQFGSRLRRLNLERGKARFEVAHEARPFVVFAGGGSITAHGTVFEVGLSRDQRVSVRLIRGSVDVRLPRPANAIAQPPSRLLRPGETVDFHAVAAQTADQPALAPPTLPNADRARDFRGARLADIVSEANRGAAVRIRLADPATGARTVSGRFRIDDTALLAERIAALFDLAVDRSDPSAIVLRPR